MPENSCFSFEPTKSCGGLLLLPNCCICDGPETPLQKLVSATPRGYPALLGYAEGVGDVTVVERMKEACKVEKLTYHKECRRDLYNKSVKVIRKSTRK